MIFDWTDQALTDLASIDDWLNRNASPDVTQTQLDLIRIRARSLQDFPRRGAKFGEDWRVMGVAGTSYLLVYRVIDDGVQILRIRHNRDDWHGA